MSENHECGCCGAEGDTVYVVVESRAETPGAILHGVFTDPEDAENVRDAKTDESIQGQEVNMYSQTVETDPDISEPESESLELPAFSKPWIRECEQCESLTGLLEEGV